MCTRHLNRFSCHCDTLFLDNAHPFTLCGKAVRLYYPISRHCGYLVDVIEERKEWCISCVEIWQKASVNVNQRSQSGGDSGGLSKRGESSWTGWEGEGGGMVFRDDVPQ